jgi:hypothetical protein
MKDFTVSVYHQLLFAIKQAGYTFFTFEDWCSGKAHGRYVVLRHDVDLKAFNSLEIAKLEAEMGIRATYYFRAKSESKQSEIIKAIVDLNHEIGYHYNDLCFFRGQKERAWENFKLQLAYFRQFYPVRTICMHGSPTSKWDNRDLWKTYSYKDVDIIGEPYIDFINPITFEEGNAAGLYFTDTGRRWDNEKYNVRDKATEKRHDVHRSFNLSTNKPVPDIHSTFDLINWFTQNQDKRGIMITTHPQRWTNNPIFWIIELIFQNIKNIIKIRLAK